MGKFYMTTDFVMDGSAEQIFAHMGFVPFRAEHLAYNGTFEYIGTSKIFEPLMNGLIVPEYTLQIEVNEESEVTAITANPVQKD